ncbi:MAG: PEP-CTERM sorting domain-containing protein [Phycisphaerae bacterium]|nr:PEP-CTERM sorting domain-containing protein [Phycisphaerae bacterium]
MKKAKWLLALFSVLMFVSGLAHALPIEVADFAEDPSGAQFTISPVVAGTYLSEGDDLLETPLLTYGETSSDGTPNTLMMSWDVVDPGPNSVAEAQAGWELLFVEDPDLTNQQIIMSINPPGNWIDKNGNPIPGAGANPNAPAKDVFLGIMSVSVVGIDNNSNILGGWGFNTDQAGYPPLALANDPGAIGLSSLANNVMQTVTINIGPKGAAVVAGSAIVDSAPPGLAPWPYIGPNFLVPASQPPGSTGPILDWTQVKSLQFYENGILQAQAQIIPGQTLGGLLNYWDHVTVTPEPVTLVLLSIGGIGAMLLRKKRRA